MSLRLLILAVLTSSFCHLQICRLAPIRSAFSLTIFTFSLTVNYVLCVPNSLALTNNFFTVFKQSISVAHEHKLSAHRAFVIHFPVSSTTATAASTSTTTTMSAASSKTSTTTTTDAATTTQGEPTGSNEM